MRRLAQEGKQITKIVAEDFPNLDYWEVYLEVYSAGERSSRGIKRMITTRLNAMAASTSKLNARLWLRSFMGWSGISTITTRPTATSFRKLGRYLESDPTSRCSRREKALVTAEL